MRKLIKNGYLLDKGSNLHEIYDILIENDKILLIEKNIQEEVDEIIDAKECIVIPGLIDHHTHLYPFIKKGIPAEAVCFSSGVTTVIDAGSCGCYTYEEVREFLKFTRLTIKSYLNVSSYGLSKLPELEDVNPNNFDKEAIKKLFEKYPDELIGLKLRISKEIVGDLDLKPLEETLKVANELKVPLMVHPTNPPKSLDKIVKLLRKGDILTHMYQNISHPLVNQQGEIYKDIIEGRNRGVIFWQQMLEPIFQ